MRVVSVVFVAVFTMIVGLGPAHALCKNSSLVGSYGAILHQGNGYAIHLFHYAADGNGHLTGKPQTIAVNIAGVGGVHKVTTVGQGKLSGTGKLSGSTTISIDGTIGTYSVTGTYTINADCTGTAQITLTGLSTSNFALVSVNGGQEFLMLETDNNTIVQGVMTQ